MTSLINVSISFFRCSSCSFAIFWYLRFFQYPGVEKHKEEHEKLRQVVRDLYNMLEEEEGPSAAFVEAVNKNVVEWLYNHIKTFDRSVAEYKFMHENGERL